MVFAAYYRKEATFREDKTLTKMDLHGCNKTKMDEGCEDCGTPSRCCPLTRIHNEIAARQKEEARYVIRDSYDPRDDPDHICHPCFETDCNHCPRGNDA